MFSVWKTACPVYSPLYIKAQPSVMILPVHNTAQGPTPHTHCSSEALQLLSSWHSSLGSSVPGSTVKPELRCTHSTGPGKHSPAERDGTLSAVRRPHIVCLINNMHRDLELKWFICKSLFFMGFKCIDLFFPYSRRHGGLTSDLSRELGRMSAYEKLELLVQVTFR